MAVYMVYIRSVITVITALFVLAQLCSANRSAAQPTSDGNKVTWPKTGAFVQNGKFQSSGETSKGDELRERAELANVRQTCANWSTKYPLAELLVHLSNKISKQSTGQKKWKTAHLKSGEANTRIDVFSSENAEGLRKRIVYPTAVNNRKKGLKFVVNAAEIIGRPNLVKLRLFNGKHGCPLRFEVKVDSSNSKKENLNCVDAMKKRYHGLFKGQHYDSNDERRISFDISGLTESVLRNVKYVCKTMATAKLTIRVKARKCSSPNDKIRNPPYLEITPIPPSTPLQCTPGETRCCMQTTAVMLKEVASKIIMPVRYRSGYCRGRCEGGSHNGPCCVPTRTTPLSVLYFEHGIIKKKVIHDVVIRECGCR